MRRKATLLCSLALASVFLGSEAKAATSYSIAYTTDTLCSGVGSFTYDGTAVTAFSTTFNSCGTLNSTFDSLVNFISFDPTTLELNGSTSGLTSNSQSAVLAIFLTQFGFTRPFGLLLENRPESTVRGTYLISTIAPIPAPAALPLLATGLGALGVLGWRRKRKQVQAHA